MSYATTIGSRRYGFADLRTLMAKASPLRSGDQLAGLAAATREERVAAKLALADVPLARFLDEALIPYEDDEVTRLIVDTCMPTASATSCSTMGLRNAGPRSNHCSCARTR